MCVQAWAQQQLERGAAAARHRMSAEFRAWGDDLGEESLPPTPHGERPIGAAVGKSRGKCRKTSVARQSTMFRSWAADEEGES